MWVNAIALGVLDVTGAFINKRVWYIDATESVECAVLRGIKNSECDQEEAVRLFRIALVMRKYTDCIDQLSYLSAATVCLTLRLLISYIYGAPSKARNANVVYIWTYVWQR